MRIILGRAGYRDRLALQAVRRGVSWYWEDVSNGRPLWLRCLVA
jgi:hypothetical protein